MPYFVISVIYFIDIRFVTFIVGDFSKKTLIPRQNLA